MTKTNHHVTLNTGALIPIIGLGTWKSLPEKAGEAVAYALTEAGYKHIDCAAIYLNEKENYGSEDYTQEIVAEILSPRDYHPRGIKVRLIDGTVGRVQWFVD